MAITTTVTALSTAAAKVATPANGRVDDPIPVIVQNLDTVITEYIGGSTVTNSGATQGIALLPGQIITMTLMQGDNLYAIAASGTPSICVMLGRQ